MTEVEDIISTQALNVHISSPLTLSILEGLS